MRETLRRFDRHRRQLLVSELVDALAASSRRPFSSGLPKRALYRDVIERAAARGGVRRLFRISLANYFACAVMMPYGRFQETAEALGLRRRRLGQRFGAGFEQVCHRLTTLQRPTARGVPFFLLRVDNAGNVSKRFSSGTFPFSKYGGTCPLWNVHATFDTPGPPAHPGDRAPRRRPIFLDRQTVRPAGRALCAAAATIRDRPRLRNKHAPVLCIARADPVEGRGDADRRELPAMRAQNCSQRAEPPITRNLILDETTRRVSSFAFSNAREL